MPIRLFLRSLAAVLILGLLLPSGPVAQTLEACESGWRDIAATVLMGQGQASMAHQCAAAPGAGSAGGACPPRAELVRRASLVAEAVAFADLRRQVSVNIDQTVIIQNGVGTDRMTMHVDGRVTDIAKCREITGDTVRVVLFGAVPPGAR